MENLNCFFDMLCDWSQKFSCHSYSSQLYISLFMKWWKSVVHFHLSGLSVFASLSWFHQLILFCSVTILILIHHSFFTKIRWKFSLDLFLSILNIFCTIKCWESEWHYLLSVAFMLDNYWILQNYWLLLHATMYCRL